MQYKKNFTSDYLKNLSKPDREVLLEDALIQSIQTIEFLHGCLTDDHYSYKYPEQTEKRLKYLKKLVPMPPTCYHSMTVEGCPACLYRNERAIRISMIKLKKFLTGNDDE